MEGKRYDLEDRLLAFAAAIIRLSDRCFRTRGSMHVVDQLVRAGTSPLFNHGEAEAAESPRDFVHKLSICLKELKEAKRALRLIRCVPLSKDFDAVDALLSESEELIRIFGASIRTARRNVVRETESIIKADEFPT